MDSIWKKVQAGEFDREAAQETALQQLFEEEAPGIYSIIVRLLLTDPRACLRLCGVRRCIFHCFFFHCFFRTRNFSLRFFFCFA